MARVGPGPGRWRAARLLSAPHRLGFFAAFVVMVLGALWWVAVVGAGALGTAPRWAVPRPAAHGLLMTLGFLPVFMAGFLFTAGPRWLAVPEVPARALAPAVTAMVVGWVVALAGFHLGAEIAAFGVASVAAGWSLLVRCFVRLLRASQVPDRVHATGVACAAATGALALWAAAGGLAWGQDLGVRAAVALALWGFVVPVFMLASHRMIPFFGAGALPSLDAWCPLWLLWALLASALSQLTGALTALWWSPLPASLRWAQVAVEGPAALLLLALALRWGSVQNLRIRMLAMLHAGFVWLGLGLALAALSHARMALGGDELSLGLAPLHATAVGYLGTTLFAMVTRVSSTHSGRPVAADDVAWALYWLFQAAALLRLMGALWPAATGPLLLAASVAWAIGTCAWAFRLSRWFGRRRVDGRPG